MKTLNTIFLGMLMVFALAAPGLFAQTRVTAHIPFDFTVTAVTMPAGDYSLTEMPGGSGVIKITNNETRKSAMVLAPSSYSTHKGKTTDEGKLIFHRYGDQYFFSEVWTPDGLRGATKPAKLERELVARGTPTELASVSIPLSGL